MSSQTPADVIARALTPAPGLEPVDFQRQGAERVLRALTEAGFVLSAPQDLVWGQCPGTPGEPHRVSLSLCSGCLEYDPE